MNRETYDALVASVEKWRENVRARIAYEARIGPCACPLCQLFIDDDCRGCPVSSATGMEACISTPYGRAEAALDAWDLRGSQSNAQRWREAAQREADFLAALVPAGGPDE